MVLKKQFDDYKAEFSSKEATDERKKDLIMSMQENLKRRCGKDCTAIACLDGKEHSLTSDNIEDLYAIDGVLSAEASKDEMTESANCARKDITNLNKYGPTNSYPST